jgi:hypothetical protein
VKNLSWQRLRHLWQAELFSPKDFVRRAFLIGLVFLIAHLSGLREFTSILNGTTGSVGLTWEQSALRGFIYILLYLAFILLVPILLLAAAISAALRKSFPHGSRTNPPKPD